MEKMAAYCALGILVAAIVIVVLLVITVIGQNKLFKNIISNKFMMHDIEEVDVERGTKTFTLIVSNRSMNDAAVTSVGIVAGRDYFDFSKRYREQNSLTEESPIVIQPRMPIKLSFDIAEVADLICGSFPGGKFQKIKVYVIDSAGNLFESKAKNFGPILRKVHTQGIEALAVQPAKTKVHVVGATDTLTETPEEVPTEAVANEEVSVSEEEA